MADLLLTAETWLGKIHKDHVSQTVTYQRGSSTVSVSATMCPSEVDQTLNGQMIVGYVRKDFLIHAADLILEGRQVSPEVGDTIAYGAQVYRVVSQNTGEKPFRESGAGGVVLRISTKQVR